MDKLTFLWIALFILTTLIEILTVSLVSIWFALAAFLVAILSIFVKNNNILIGTFTFFSILFLILTRPIFKKYFKKNNNNFEYFDKKVKIIGKEDAKYIVKFKGSNWNAISIEKEYEIGDEAKIVNFEGNKIVIE